MTGYLVAVPIKDVMNCSIALLFKKKKWNIVSIHSCSRKEDLVEVFIKTKKHKASKKDLYSLSIFDQMDKFVADVYFLDWQHAIDSKKINLKSDIKYSLFLSVQCSKMIHAYARII